jgi:hypothetical protein
MRERPRADRCPEQASTGKKYGNQVGRDGALRKGKAPWNLCWLKGH